MKRIAMLAAPLLFCAFTLGCGNNGSDSGGSVSEEEFVELLAKTFCGAVHNECMCDMPDDADEATCIQSESTDLQYDVDAAQAAGLQYDAGCAGDFVDQWKSIGCKSLSEIDFDGSCADACSVYHGAVAVGEPCTVYGGYSDCASGLACSEGVCYDPCESQNDALQEGEACDDTNPDAGYCDYGKDLYCDAELMVCTKAPGLGQPCPGYICAGGAVCDQTDMMCVAAPGVGEPCPNYVCAAGATCDTAAAEPTCVADEPFVCL